MMERAPLRPVPSRAPGPIVPAEAVRYVTGELPGLDEAAAAAFALVALVGRSRLEVRGSSDSAAATGLSGEALADALARKALRRKLYPLPGSGWCERAERLISDRLDQALEDPGPARLEVHLANCGRCVEHERRLGQAREALVAGFLGAHPAQEAEFQQPATAPEAPPLPPVLRAVETPALPAPSSVTGALPPAPSPDKLPPSDTEEPLQLEEASPLEEPPPAVPSARRKPSSTLWTPAAPSPPRTLLTPSPPLPVAPVAPTPAVTAPTVPSTPPPIPPSDPPPPEPSASAPSPAPLPAPWTTGPVASWTPPTTMPGAEPWRTAPARLPLAGRATLEDEDTWSSVGPLVAVLAVCVVVFVLAGLLTL